MTILLVAVAATLFFVLAAQFLRGDEERLARTLLFGFPGPFDADAPSGPKWLFETARYISALGSPEVLAPLTAAILGYLLYARQLGPAAFILISAGAGTLGGYLLKEFFERVRPHHSIEPGAAILNTSFPSGHAMLAALVYLSVGIIVARAQSRRSPRLYVLALSAGIILLVGVSRVYIGVHWPTDVLAGWAVGGGWVAFCWLAMRVAVRSHWGNQVRRKIEASLRSFSGQTASSKPQ